MKNQSGRQRETETERQRDKETETETETERQKQRDRDRETANSEQWTSFKHGVLSIYRDRERQRQRQRQRGTWTLCFVKFSGASKNAVQTVDSLQEVQYIILIIMSDYHIKYKISWIVQFLCYSYNELWGSILKVTVQFERYFWLMENITVIYILWRNPINLYITEKLIKVSKFV